MERRPYAGVIKEFLDRRHELMSARNGAKFYRDVDVFPEKGVPIYGLKNNGSGLELYLKVPENKKDGAQINLVDNGWSADFKPYIVAALAFNWRSGIDDSVITRRFDVDRNLGRVLSELNESGFGGPRRVVRNAYDALNNLFEVMHNKRRREVEIALGLKKDPRPRTPSHDYLFAFNG